jgi:hypothetical protein
MKSSIPAFLYEQNQMRLYAINASAGSATMKMTLTNYLQANCYFCIVEDGIADIRVRATMGPSD